MSLTHLLTSTIPAAAAAAGWVTAARRASSLRRRLHTGELTGLPNRLALAERIRSRPNDTAAIGLLLLDLDNFKPVNDQHGHDEGNRVLRHVAEQLRIAARPSELPARLHGDEFALLLGAVPSGAAGMRTVARRAEALRRAVAEPLITDRARHTASSSVGAAVLPARHAELGALLSLADAAMYRVKGRRPVSQPDIVQGRTAA